MINKARKSNRLQGFDYNSDGVYFITICVKDRKRILSEIVGAGVLACPETHLLHHGRIADKYIKQLNNFYDNILIAKYAIMPDHIHLIISVKNGQSGTPAPTNNNSEIPKFVRTFKRFCNREYKKNIWQRSYYDHIVRNQQDYNEIWKYIENNPKKWLVRNQKATAK